MKRYLELKNKETKRGIQILGWQRKLNLHDIDSGVWLYPGIETWYFDGALSLANETDRVGLCPSSGSVGFFLSSYWLQCLDE